MDISITHLEVPLLQIKAHTGRYSIDHRLKPWIAQHCGIAEDAVLDYMIEHRSLDARRKPDLRLVYRLRVHVQEDSLVREETTIVSDTPAPDQNHRLYQLTTLPSLPKHPLIVGTGPAGMMAAYLLALYGCQPLMLERGVDVEQRRVDINTFLQTRILNPNSNYLFGEGGAGTYSDGKLYTRIKDDRIKFLLEAYVAARAPRRICYDHHPHIGSDILPLMVKRLRKQIEQWGGRFRWGATVQDILIQNGRCRGVILENGEHIEAPLTIIACGHSARTLIRKLIQHAIAYRAKDFQLGCRIEHPQHLIDQAQYGWIPPRDHIGAAEYNLVSRPKGKIAPVTTFCMCPGGEIIPATSDAEQLCTNGMSRFRRSGSYANAGLIVNQECARFNSVIAALDMLTAIEHQAFLVGTGSDASRAYSCPAQSALAFVRGEEGLHTSETSYRFGVTLARLDQLLPQDTVQALREALKYFEKLIPGFMHTGVLVGVETRISSPIQFERHPETLSSSLPGLYLAGEGAGYAGGIISSALDGLRLAETILTGKPARRKTAQ